MASNKEPMFVSDRYQMRYRHRKPHAQLDLVSAIFNFRKSLIEGLPLDVFSHTNLMLIRGLNFILIIT